MDRFADFILAPIGLFSGRPLAVAIALSILGAALFIWLGILLPAERRFVGPLRRIARAIRTVRAGGESPEQQFAEIDLLMARSPLDVAWNRFRSAVEFVDGKALSYADPANFFCVATLPGHGYPKWSSTLSGVFLTVGLFFTFVGLSAALLQMGGDGHGALAPAQLRTAVEGILAVSSVKFITSIAGILSYIFWSLVARQQVATQVAVEEALIHEIRGLSSYVAPEMLLRRQLRLTESQQDAIAGSVGAAVADALAPLRAELSAMSAQIGRTNSTLVEGAGEMFGTVWKDGIGLHIEAFGDQMTKALSALEILPEKVRATESGFGAEINRTAEKLADSALRMSAAFEQGQASMAATLARFDAKIGAIPETLAAASETASQNVGASVRKALDDVAATSAEASRAGAETMAARVGDIARSLALAAASLKEASESSGEQMRASRTQLAEGAAESAKLISDSAASAGATLSRTVEAFALAVHRLTSKLDDVVQTLDQQNLRLSKSGEIVTGASNDLARAAGAMESAATPLTAASASFQEAMERFSRAADKVRQVSDSGESIAAHIASFGTQMTGTLAAFEALPEKIRASESGFGAEIGKTAERLAEAALRMNAGFERGQASMAATLAAFESKISAIPSSLAEAAERSSRDIGATVRKTLDEAAQTAAEASKAGAEVMSRRVAEIALSLTSAAAALKEASEVSGEHLRATRGELVEGVAQGAKIIADNAETTSAQLARTVQAFGLAVHALSAKLGDIVQGLDAQNERLERAGQVVSGASTSLVRAAGSMESAASPFASATNTFQGAMDRFSQAADQVRQISESGQSVADRFERTADVAQKALGAHAEKFGAVERSVSQMLGELVSGVQNLGKEISECIESYDNEIAKSIGSLEAALIDVGDIIDTRGQAAKARAS